MHMACEQQRTLQRKNVRLMSVIFNPCWHWLAGFYPFGYQIEMFHRVDAQRLRQAMCFRLRKVIFTQD